MADEPRIEWEFIPDPEVAELTEMLTAATDTAVQRGKRIDQLEAALATYDEGYEAGFTDGIVAGY